jgi:WS/DGAT/MGAT family acyltransferase
VAYGHYDRLSALDALFLEIEGASMHMHVGAIAVFEAAPLRTPQGALAIDKLRAALEVSLRNSPRFRQKLSIAPVLKHPVWVDDEHFNLNYHLRHTSLPRPGSIRLLKRLAGRIMSQQLDRGKPLWEMWVVEGVEDDCFALIVKAHHCMVDGISGLDLLTGIMRLDPNPTVRSVRPWYPRPPPNPRKLVVDEILRRGTWPLRAGRRALAMPRETLGNLQEALLGVGEVVSASLRPTSRTPLNPNIGPYRRFDWTRFDLAAVKEVKDRLGGTLNDVVLACAAGAIGRFLMRRGLRVDDLVFRAQVPMSIRTGVERGAAGNRVVMLLALLPIAERNPRKRLSQVIENTRRIKQSRQRAGVEFLEELSDLTLSSIWSYFARLATWQRAFNVVITNVPGPPRSAYLLGAPMRGIYPLVPLAGNQALGIALFSYDGGLYWGFNSDWDALPDLHHLVLGIEQEFELLRKAAVRN